MRKEEFIKDIELRKYLGLEESNIPWRGRMSEDDPQNLWEENQKHKFFEVRSMAYEGGYKMPKALKALCDYLGVELKEYTDRSGITQFKVIKLTY